MSIYSGFATRKQQVHYFQLSETLITALVKRIVKFYRGEHCEEKVFRDAIAKIYIGLQDMESRKHLNPKYSPLVDPLIELFQTPTLTPPDAYADTQREMLTISSNTEPLKRPTTTATVSKYESSRPIEQELEDRKPKTSQTRRQRIFSSSDRPINSLEDGSETLTKLGNQREETVPLPQFFKTYGVRKSSYSSLSKSNKILKSRQTSRELPKHNDTLGQEEDSRYIYADTSIKNKKKCKSLDKYKLTKDLNRTYENVISNLINTKAFKRKKYMVKKREQDIINGIIK